MNGAASESETTSAWEEARRQGVDMELLEETIRMTPDQRFAAHRLRLLLMLALEQEEEDGLLGGELSGRDFV